MNAIYKVIWNDAIRQYQVVNELCRSRRKACSVKAVHESRTSHHHAGVALVALGVAGTLALSLPAFAADWHVGDTTWAVGDGVVNATNDDATENVGLLPDLNSGESFVIDSLVLVNPTTSLYSQDEIKTTSNALVVVGQDYVVANISNLPSVVIGDNKASVYQYSTNNVELLYQIGGGWITGTGNVWGVSVTGKLTQITLKGQGDQAFYVDTSSKQSDDLGSQITGSGDIVFGYSSTTGVNPHGYLIIGDTDQPDDQSTNNYTGKTFVGYTGQLTTSNPTTIYFGKNEAFGNTSMLQVAPTSDVQFGGVSGEEKYTQTVGGLSGTGLLALGSQASLTLNQSKIQGVTKDPDSQNNEPGKIYVQNKFTGGVDSNFNVNLSGEVSGWEVVFADQTVDTNAFSGTILLTNSAVTAYREGLKEEVEGSEFNNPNKILTGSTLQLGENGTLKVDVTGTVKDLTVSGAGATIEFDNLASVEKDKSALTVTGNLTLNQDGQVSIKDFDSVSSGMGQATQSASLIAADDGMLTHLINVADGGNIDLNGHKLSLQETLSGNDSNIVQNDKKVAKGTWKFEQNLRYDGDKTFDLAYVLTQVDVSGGESLLIEGAVDANTTQDFKALITGDGGVEFKAGSDATDSGAVIEVGNTATTEKNSYTGKTVVAEGTTVVLVEDKAFGETSELLAQGNVELKSGISQTVHGIDENGTGKITISDRASLAVEASGNQTINNEIVGSGKLSINLRGSGALTFGSSGGFTGDLTLSSGSFSLGSGSNANAEFAKRAGIILSNGASFDFGSTSHTIKDLVVNADDVKLSSSALVIGSKNPSLTISGSLTLNANTNLTLTGVSVADNLSLVDYDASAVSQSFIQAGSVVAGDHKISLSGSGNFNNLSKLTLDYTQGGSKVAETVWSVSNQLSASGSGFNVDAQLSEIHLIGNVVISGAGTDYELSALVTDGSGASGHGLQFSLAGGASEAAFTVVKENTYTGKTTVDADVTVTLTSDHAFGNTSLLVAEGNVSLNDGVEQTVKGLLGSGTITLGDTSELSLTQSGSATISNDLAGKGTFNVNLGGTDNELSFTKGPTFGGTLALSSGSVTLVEGDATSKVLSTAGLTLGSGGRLNVDAQSGQNTLASLVFGSGSQANFSTITMGSSDADTAYLNVTDNVVIESSAGAQISIAGVALDGTQNILSADNAGIKQALITASGGITGSISDLVASSADLPDSEIRNTTDGDVVAYGKWTGANESGGMLSLEGKTIYAALKLSAIELADDEYGGLVLDLYSAGTSDRELSAQLTNHNGTAGNITFTGSGSVTVNNASNNYKGETYVTNGAKVTLGSENALGQSSLLLVSGQGSQVNLYGQTQTLGGLDLDVADAITGSGSLTLTGETTSTITGANTGLTADVTLRSGHAVNIDNVASLGSSGSLSLTAEKTALNINGASDQNATLTKTLSGKGNVSVTNSTFNVSGDNSGFSGTWTLNSGAHVSLAGSGVDAALGSGAKINLSDSGASLKLDFSGATTATIDEVFSGSGQLIVEGTKDQSFGFESSDSRGYSGTLTLNTIGMTVADESNNAVSLSDANVVLASGAVVTVSGASVNTFNNVTVSSGGGGFEIGGMGFGTGVTGTSVLSIKGAFEASGKTTIDVSTPSQALGDVAGNIAQSALLSSGQTPFQTLIATEKTISDNTLKQLKLSTPQSD